MALHNETITKPRFFKGETFTGVTTLDFDAKLGDCIFDDCALHSEGALRAVLVPPGRKPMATFRNGCFLRGSEGGKVVLGQWLGFYDSRLVGEDGIFGQRDGLFMHVDRCTIDIHADLPAHGDGAQAVGGSWFTMRGSTVKVRGTGGNSCVFLESLAPPKGLGPCKHVRLVSNIFDGGGYGVWSIEDPNAPGGPNEDIVLARNKYRNQVFGDVAWTAGSKPLRIEE